MSQTNGGEYDLLEMTRQAQQRSLGYTGESNQLASRNRKRPTLAGGAQSNGRGEECHAHLVP